jgi:hypothetical protein
MKRHHDPDPDDEERRVRARQEALFGFQDLPEEMKMEISLNLPLRSLLSFAQATRQSDEVVAKAIAFVFERDITGPFTAANKGKTEGIYFADESILANGTPRLVDSNGDWNLYKRTLTKVYRLFMESRANTAGEIMRRFGGAFTTYQRRGEEVIDSGYDIIVNNGDGRLIVSIHIDNRAYCTFAYPQNASPLVVKEVAKMKAMFDSKPMDSYFTYDGHRFSQFFLNLFYDESPRLVIHFPVQTRANQQRIPGRVISNATTRFGEDDKA